MPRPFVAGDRVLLTDAKQRRHLITLTEDGAFHSHTGVLEHSQLIGAEEGVTVRTTMGSRMVAVRPTLSEYILKMPRGAQVIYPKDLGPILMLADVFPGAQVLESGVGSGALTMTLLRAIGPEGHVLGYELRDDFADRARRNVDSFLGPDVPLTIEVRDIYDGIDVDDLDRILLDLPEPWRAPSRRDHAVLPPDDRSGDAAPRRARQLRVRDDRDARGPAARLACRRAVRTTGPPHGGPHRLPYPCAPAGSGAMSLPD